jgi:hypothetical protein
MAPLKKGSLVRVLRDKLENSVEALASDRRFPSYVFDSDGEILDIKTFGSGDAAQDYARLKFALPTPDLWLRLDQLTAL